MADKTPPTLSGFRHIDELVAFVLPRLASIYAILLTGMIVVIFTDSSVLAIILAATLESRRIITIDLLPLLIIMSLLNIAGIGTFAFIIYRASRPQPLESRK